MVQNTWQDRQPGGYVGGGTDVGGQVGIDSLNGILIKGLLGGGPSSLILGALRLGGFGISIGISTIPGKPSVYPQGPVVNYPRRDDDDVEPQDQYLNIDITFNNKIYKNTYKLSNKNANVLLKINESIKKTKKLSSVTVNKLVVKPVKKTLKVIVKGLNNK